ncbi:hypothetical protein J5N97_014721 [Dioscorea zingiberensis]|uniref:RNA polymerase II nuclear localization protein SLC7A6OS n=1 Tax=Dioscorea zingiberensis TaxID=325984 RepID=A0A9D5HKC2_9LILI|nr:hypothetical protein J5N97_014721 [Dioscorea zingiberensis]
MAELGEASSSRATLKGKPVVVRVKRKASQEPLDALWLEINERPFKKPLLDLASLSIGESAGKALEELKTKKVLVQHVETISASEATKDVLLTFLDNPKQDRLLLEAREKHEDLARSARFTQIWKSRMDGMEMDDNSLQEICHFYDVVRVDEQEKPGKLSEPQNVSIEDNAILHSYLPLLREFLPTAAEEIESDVSSFQENYVYDLYAVDDHANENEEDSFTSYPLVQVDDEDEYYEGPPQCEYETDDSNAEDNPLNEYHDEESS